MFQRRTHPGLQRQLRELRGNDWRLLLGCPLAALGAVAIGMIVTNFVLHGADINTRLMHAGLLVLGGVTVVGVTARTTIRGMNKDRKQAQQIIQCWLEQHASGVQYFLYHFRNWVVRPLTYSAILCPAALLVLDWFLETQYYLDYGIFMILAIFALLLVTFLFSLHHPLLCGPDKDNPDDNHSEKNE